MDLYKERENCERRIREIDFELNKDMKKMIDRITELKCRLPDDGISPEDRKCVFCENGTVINKYIEGWNPLRLYYVYCPRCKAEGPKCETKKEAVEKFEHPKGVKIDV